MPLKTRPPSAGLPYYCALRRGLHVNWPGRRWSEPNWLKQGERPAKQTSPDRWRRLPPPNFRQGPLNAGTLTLTTDCAICSDSVCHVQDQYSVLGLFTRHWTNKIKTETDHLQIRLCKHLTLCACPAHRKMAWQPLDSNRSNFWQEADSGWAIESPRNVASLLYALSHTRSHKHIFTPCSRLGLESLPGAKPSVARSPKQPAASRNVSFKAPSPFATEGC